MSAAPSSTRSAAEERAWTAAATVTDPEVPVLTIADLGVLRSVREENGRIIATITPTYSGCPAMDMIALHVELALREAGFHDVAVETTLSPAWTTDWMSEDGRNKLAAYGIAPPARSGRRGALFGAGDDIRCPHCGSSETALVSAFGSTACKALYRCEACREPFDYFKCH
ncbi:phenylacetate-CoA oxygenase subunit PaaJ [Acuticoccus sp. M5D2P5]|nr:phenylacetate-CoA oxygenase subunit PaaJ [Acuticoccus kalidii]